MIPGVVLFTPSSVLLIVFIYCSPASLIHTCSLPSWLMRRRSLRRRLQDDLLREYVRGVHRPPELLDYFDADLRVRGSFATGLLDLPSTVAIGFLDPASTFAPGL
ncbi:hypothetical protein ATANTOWER_028310, partial [Ataeniobius toweri]|nr:hypothetical protein [Ataeniobius toweri]